MLAVDAVGIEKDKITSAHVNNVSSSSKAVIRSKPVLSSVLESPSLLGLSSILSSSEENLLPL